MLLTRVRPVPTTQHLRTPEPCTPHCVSEARPRGSVLAVPASSRSPARPVLVPPGSGSAAPSSFGPTCGRGHRETRGGLRRFPAAPRARLRALTSAAAPSRRSRRRRRRWRDGGRGTRPAGSTPAPGAPAPRRTPRSGGSPGARRAARPETNTALSAAGGPGRGPGSPLGAAPPPRHAPPRTARPPSLLVAQPGGSPPPRHGPTMAASRRPSSTGGAAPAMAAPLRALRRPPADTRPGGERLPLRGARGPAGRQGARDALTEAAAISRRVPAGSREVGVLGAKAAAAHSERRGPPAVISAACKRPGYPHPLNLRQPCTLSPCQSLKLYILPIISGYTTQLEPLKVI